MNFEEIISIIFNAICTIIIFFLYWLQKNKFKKTGPSVINKMIEDEYKRWYLYNSTHITSKNFSIHGFNKILYEFKVRLLRKGFKKKHIEEYIFFLQETNNSGGFSIYNLLLGIVAFLNANNVINIFLAKKDQETYLEILLNKFIQIYFNIKPLMPIILYSLVVIVWLYLIYKLGRINLNKLRAGLLVELLNIWDNDVVYDTVINEEDLDSDKIYLEYKIKEPKLLKFLYGIYGESLNTTINFFEDGLKKDNKILKILRFTGKAILTSVLPLYLATASIVNIYGFLEPNETYIRIIALIFAFIMGIGFLLILNSQFTGGGKETWKWMPGNSNSIKLVYYENNIFKLLIYIIISVIMIFLFRNIYRQQIESSFFINLMLFYYILSISVTFVKLGEDNT